jgi:predicted dithiol-disulfide oxidoreductase (DUF899 family)
VNPVASAFCRRVFTFAHAARLEYALDVLWNMLDRTPEGRGDFHPKLEY